jgi:hypothetical protein
MIAIGTYHFDLEGPKRLKYALDKLRPRSISTEWPKGDNISEWTNYLSRLQETLINQLQKKAFPDAIYQLLRDSMTIGAYELRVPFEYSKKTGAKLFLIDHPKLSGPIPSDPTPEQAQKSLEEVLNIFFEGWDQEVIDKLHNVPYGKLREIIDPIMDQTYFRSIPSSRSAEEYFERSLDPNLKRYLEDKTFQEEREEFMTSEVLKANSDLHIGGLAHLFPGNFLEEGGVKPLYKRLGNSLAKSIRLCEVYGAV